MSQNYSVSSQEQINRLIAFATTYAPHRVPLLREVRSGRLALVEPDREGLISSTRLKRLARPVLVLLGDDDEFPTGPDGWACAEGVLSWARHVVIHGAGARADDYLAFGLAAQITGRLLVIETCSDRVEDWHAAARRLASRAVCQRIVPPVGQPHPVAMARGTMQ